MVNFPRCNRCHHKPTRASNISTKCIKITHIEAEKGMLFGGRGLKTRSNQQQLFRESLRRVGVFLEMLKSLTFGTADGGGCVGFCFFLFVCYYLRVMIHIYIYVLLDWCALPFLWNSLPLFREKKTKLITHNQKRGETSSHVSRRPSTPAAASNHLRWNSWCFPNRLPRAVGFPCACW